MSSRPAPAHSAWLWILVAIELALLAGIWLIDFGWREPGQFGLTAVSQLLAMLAYVPLLIGGVVWAIRQGHWGALALQVIVPLAFWGWSSGVGASRDPADHQDLVGQTRSEVMEALGDRRISWRGERGDSASTVLTFDGLDVYLEDERRVTRVVPGHVPGLDSSFASIDAADHQDVVGQPYPIAFRALLDRGGTTFGIETDSAGTYQQFDGLRLYLTGEERAARVAAPSF